MQRALHCAGSLAWAGYLHTVLDHDFRRQRQHAPHLWPAASQSLEGRHGAAEARSEAHNSMPKFLSFKWVGLLDKQAAQTTSWRLPAALSLWLALCSAL